MSDGDRRQMGSLWKKIRRVTEDKMLFFSGTQTRCLTDGDVVNSSEVRHSLFECTSHYHPYISQD